MEKSVLDILLAGTVRNVQKEPETATMEVKRLSKLFGAPVVLEVRGLTFNEVADLKGDKHMDVKIVHTATVTPIFSDVRLARKMGLLAEDEDWGAHGVLQTDLVTALLTPGEIEEISRRVQRLSGYLQLTVTEVKKN